MAFTKGRKKTGGKQKGSKNKKTLEVQEIFDSLNFNPVEFNIHIAQGNWKKLGFKSGKRKIMDALGTVHTVDQISFEARQASGMKLLPYYAPQLKSVELKAPPGEENKPIFQFIQIPCPDPLPE